MSDWKSIDDDMRPPEGEWLMILTDESGLYESRIHRARKVVGGWQNGDYNWLSGNVIAWTWFPDKPINKPRG